MRIGTCLTREGISRAALSDSNICSAYLDRVVFTQLNILFGRHPKVVYKGPVFTVKILYKIIVLDFLDNSMELGHHVVVNADLTRFVPANIQLLCYGLVCALVGKVEDFIPFDVFQTLTCGAVAHESLVQVHI